MTARALPSLSFDTAKFEEEDRLDAVSDLWRHYLTFNVDRRSRKSFFLRSNVWWLNDCVFVNSVAAPMTCHRPPPPDEESLISVSYLRHGMQDYVLNGALQHQEPGAVHVSLHSHQTLRQCHTDSEIFIFYLPTIRIGLIPNQEFPVRIFATTTPVGAMLRSMLLSLPEALSNCKQEQAGTLADGICAFLESVLRESPDTNAATVTHFKLSAIRRYIEDHIGDDSLDAERICRVFGISRPTLYRLFRESGGVMAYVTKRRTHHIFSELSRSSPRWGLVKSVAGKFGFQDMTQFTRAFRRHTGTTPSSIVGLSAPDTSGRRNAHSAGTSGRLSKPLIFSRSMQAM